MFQFFESICLKNGKPQLISYHQERVNMTLGTYASKAKIELKQISKEIPESENLGLKKMRVSYDLAGFFSVKIADYHPLEHKKIKIIEDIDLNYQLKSENRHNFKIHQHYNQEFDDLIFSQNGFITDSSYANVAFFDGQNWFTPMTKLLSGVKRAYLIDQKIVKVKHIKVDDLKNFTHFALINAMRDLDLKLPIDIITY